MRLTKLGHILVAVHNLPRSRDFYTRVLGFEVLEEAPEHGGLFMTIGDGTHVVDLVPLPGSRPPRVPESIGEFEPFLGIRAVPGNRPCRVSGRQRPRSQMRLFRTDRQSGSRVGRDRSRESGKHLFLRS